MVTGSIAVQGAFELGSVVMAVEGLFENAVTHSGAALLLATVKSHDEYTFFHSVNSCILALAAGRSIGIDRDNLLPIGVGAILHDIGKVAVDPTVLNYPGRIDAQQWAEIKIHPQEGALAIMAAGGDNHEIAATVALEHHARYDGEGYPEVQRSRRPHPFSRLVSVVDTYDAITSRRSYRRAETPHRALQVLLSRAGSMYDPEMVTAFIRMVGLYPPGSILRLTTGEMVVVTAPPPEPDAPLPVLLVRDTSGFELMEPEPMRVRSEEVVEQLLPQQAGIDPGEYLEAAEAAIEAG
jgi:HD-GYP domain-containing protein (c-di-GMP phosphodiesterase class II)